MLERFLNILLIILVVIAFFFGVRVGKNIQKVDTPERVVYKTKKNTPTSQLKRHTLALCNYSFITPDTVKVKISSQSAVITTDNDVLNLLCSTKAPIGKSSSYIQLPSGKYITFTEKGNLFDDLKEGFITDVRYKLAP